MVEIEKLDFYFCYVKEVSMKIARFLSYSGISIIWTKREFRRYW